MWLSGLLVLAVTAALRSGAAVQLLLCRWEWWVWLLVLLLLVLVLAVAVAVAVCSGALVQLLLCRWKCMVVALDKTVWMLASVLVLYVCLSVDV